MKYSKEELLCLFKTNTEFDNNKYTIGSYYYINKEQNWIRITLHATADQYEEIDTVLDFLYCDGDEWIINVISGSFNGETGILLSTEYEEEKSNEM